MSQSIDFDTIPRNKVRRTKHNLHPYCFVKLTAKDVIGQIKQFFRSPVSSIVCGGLEDDKLGLDAFYGLVMEYSLRKCIGASVPEFTDITGYIGEMNPLKRFLGLETSLFGHEEDESTLVEESASELRCNDLAPGELARKYFAIWGTSETYLKQGIYATGKSETFKFSLPIEWGQTLLNKEKEFQLPEEIKIKKRHLKPESFQKIQNNLFIDRKPRKGITAKCVCNDTCDEQCINKILFIECSVEPEHDDCGNQRFQKKKGIKELEVIETKGRGFGTTDTCLHSKGCIYY